MTIPRAFFVIKGANEQKEEEDLHLVFDALQ